MSDTMKVYEAIAAVTLDLSKDGIVKDRKNTTQGYTFRGIDDVYNALSPIIAKHKLCILPRILTRAVTERTTQKGGVLFSVVVEAEFDFISAEDGSRHVVRTFGEAMDSADKATNKAMSAAYKYAAMQAFCIPTEGDNDADAETPSVAPKQPQSEPNHDAERHAYMGAAFSVISAAKLETDLRTWWADEKDHRRINHLTQADVDCLKEAIARRTALLRSGIPVNKNGAAIYEPMQPEAVGGGETPFDDQIPFGAEGR